MNRIHEILKARRADERGLALLDVLLGMAIFALIVIIGVQNFSTLRNRAYVTQVSSDVKQAGTAVEGHRITNGKYPDSISPQPEGVNLTAGVSLTRYTQDESGNTFSLCAEHVKGPWAMYDSARGTVVATGNDGGCAEATGEEGTPEASCGTPHPVIEGALHPLVDDDGDGWTNGEEESSFGSDPCDPNDPFPGGGGPFGDYDGDGIENYIEIFNGSNCNPDFNPGLYPGTGLYAEGVSRALDPNSPFPGGPDGDADGDGYPNVEEVTTLGSPGCSAAFDPDWPAELHAAPTVTSMTDTVSLSGGTLEITGTRLAKVERVRLYRNGIALSTETPSSKSATSLTVNVSGVPSHMWSTFEGAEIEVRLEGSSNPVPMFAPVTAGTFTFSNGSSAVGVTPGNYTAPLSGGTITVTGTNLDQIDSVWLTQGASPVFSTTIVSKSPTSITVQISSVPVGLEHTVAGQTFGVTLVDGSYTLYNAGTFAYVS